jgi:hypothetical protein
MPRCVDHLSLHPCSEWWLLVKGFGGGADYGESGAGFTGVCRNRRGNRPATQALRMTLSVVFCAHSICSFHKECERLKALVAELETDRDLLSSELELLRSVCYRLSSAP